MNTTPIAALPIMEKEDLIIETILDNQVIVIVGETGSGKTTQVPIMLYEAGFAQKGTIGVTQPRRFAATSVAQYLAGLSRKNLGDVVGYKVRFDRASDPGTAVKFMTVGILLRELQTDELLSEYSVIMIDEAHERSTEIDFLLGLLKRLLPKRRDLKIVIASATIDEKKFSDYFGGAPVIKSSGRMYPVEVKYLDEDIEDQDRLCELIVRKAMDIHGTTLSGDVLVFVPGKDDVYQIVERLNNANCKNVVVLPLYRGVDPAEMEKVYWPYPGKRKIIVSTNIAETSVTVDGIVYVIDSGLVKESDYNSETGIEGLNTTSHSRAGCDQRKGRAGRTRPGVCYRMYTEKDLSARQQFTTPEIQRVDLSRVVLGLELLGLNALDFPFIDAPERENVQKSYESLMVLGALDFRSRKITDMGKQIASLPCDPISARLLLEARKFECLKEIITIVAFFSTPYLFLRPKGQDMKADEMHALFKHPKSDLLTFLNVWKAYKKSSYSKEWCVRHFLNPRALWEVGMVREQFKEIFKGAGVKRSSANDESVILKCIASGLRYNILHYVRGNYSGLLLDAKDVKIHRSSVLSRSKSRFVVATSIREMSGRCAYNCSIVRPEWLAEFLPQLFVGKGITFQSYQKGSPHVVGEQLITFRGEMVGTRTVNIPIEKARFMQSQHEQGMRDKGFVKLAFERNGSGLVSHSEGRLVELSLKSKIRVEPGIHYYCSLVPLGEALFAEAKMLALEL